jgi:hypothetical protein
MHTYDCPKRDFRLIETKGMHDPRAEMVVSNALVDGVGNMPITDRMRKRVVICCGSARRVRSRTGPGWSAAPPTHKATLQGLVHELPGRMWRCKGRA